MTKFNTGIYQIVNQVNNKRYIGSAVNIKTRKRKHFQALRGNKHYNLYLQRSYNKYKKENFEFQILLYCSKEYLLFYEQCAINAYDFKKELYNISPTAGSPLGVKHTPETNKKNSERTKGEKNPFYGKNHNEETKKIIGEKSKNKILTEETRKKLSKAGKGRRHSEETKKKISNAQKGEKNHNYGKKASPETRIKMSNTRKGKSNNAIKKPVYQIDKNTNEIIKEWDSATDAKNELNIYDISKVCKGKRKTAGDFKWEFVNKKDKGK